MGRIADLRSECDELRSRVDYLTKIVRAEEYLSLPQEWRLTFSEHAILMCLFVAPGHMKSFEHIMDVLYDVRKRDRPNPSTIRMLVHHLRKRRKDIHIETIWGFGYRLSPETVEKIRKVVKIDVEFPTDQAERIKHVA